eukprot:COSAG05_NODE_4749_length_1387_cov_1.233696_1_plen_418_part_01
MYQDLTGPRIAELASQMAPLISQDEAFVLSGLDAMAAKEDADNLKTQLEAEKESLERQMSKVQRDAQEQVAQLQEELRRNQERKSFPQFLADRLQLTVTETEQLVQNLQQQPSEGQLVQLCDDLATESENLRQELANGTAEISPALKQLFNDGNDAAKKILLAALEKRITHVLVERLNLSEPFAEAVAAAVEPTCTDAAAAVGLLGQHGQIIPVLQHFARSAACDHALEAVSLGLRTLLRERIEEAVPSKRAKKKALAVVSHVNITRSHVQMLFDGRIDELMKQLLTGLAEATLNNVLPGLQRKVEQGTEVLQRVESVAATADACSSGLATDIAERVLEAGSGIPVVGKALELMHGLYKLAKGAKSNQSACERFCGYVKRVERMLKRARGDADIAESISEVEEIIAEAIAFMEKLDGK